MMQECRELRLTSHEGRVVEKRELTPRDMIIEGIRNALRLNATNMTQEEIRAMTATLSSLDKALRTHLKGTDACGSAQFPLKILCLSAVEIKAF